MRLKRISVHHESAESTVRVSRSVGVEPEQQELSGPDR